MPLHERPTVSLHYEDVKPAAPADGSPCLVFLHGWCDSSSTWTETVAELSKDFRCIALDMRGHGRSAVPHDHTLSHEALSNDVVALCRTLGVERPVLVGHSFGGYVASSVAHRFPGFARAVMVIDQPLAFGELAKALAPIEGVIRGRESHLAWRKAFLEPMLGEATPEVARRRVLEGIEKTPVDVALGFWASIFEQTLEEITDLADHLMRALGGQPSVSVESAAKPEYHELLRAKAPGIETHVVASGHWIHLERPAEIRALVRQLAARP